MTRYNPARTRILHQAALACLLLAFVARDATADGSKDQGDSLDEVEVQGTRSELDQLRQQMVLIEDRFNERYNALNTNHDFDTHCHVEARIGTNTMRRYCRAVYQEREQQKEGQAYAEALKNMNQDPPQPWVPPTPPAIKIEAWRKDYQNNIRNVVKKNPELIEMLRQRYELGQRYAASQRKIFGPKAKDEDKSEPAPAVTP
jgi:hypothetical protein